MTQRLKSNPGTQAERQTALPTKIDLARRIRRRREDLGISRPVMAERLGMGYTGYSHKETGEREISSLELAVIARVLGVSTDYLLGEETEAERREQEIALYYNGLPEPIQIAELSHMQALYYAHHPETTAKALGGVVQPAREEESQEETRSG